MSYKTIVVHVDASRHAAARIKLAAELAAREQAHLIGAAMTGIPQFVHDTMALSEDNPDIAPYLDILRKRTDEALKKFEAGVRQANVSSFECRRVDDEAGYGLALQARYADLVVLGQHDPADMAANTSADFPEFVVMNCPRPVLIVPHAGNFSGMAKKVLIAWNDSNEAATAVGHALPILRQAEAVEIAVFTSASRQTGNAPESGADLALYLARHLVKADVMQETTTEDIGKALLNTAAGLGSDLIVMGCYGHSRFRETLLGGVTRTVLRSMTVPVLMSH